jgi:hypothetical protein
MRAAAYLGSFLLALTAISIPVVPGRAQSCADDYVSLETITGTIIEIAPAPEPFPTADISMTGPNPCERMWLQALKADAARCHVGDRIEAKGYVTMDPENASWGINPERNDYMIFGQDFTCG